MSEDEEAIELDTLSDAGIEDAIQQVVAWARSVCDSSPEMEGKIRSKIEELRGVVYLSACGSHPAGLYRAVADSPGSEWLRLVPFLYSVPKKG